MEIRPAEEKDISAIVALLKISLGESLMPKSEAFWRWKHLDNPFGESPVLVASENNQLVGVRAFMRWEWRQGEKIFKAVRAVDTATHPDFQGKGIFTKLSLKLAEQCRQLGVDFIFNTPNRISKPGYIKMGWESVGKLPVGVKLNVYSHQQERSLSDRWEDVIHHPALLTANYNVLRTNVSSAYLFWRYRDNPNIRYKILSHTNERPFILIYREKKTGGFTEIRIADLFCNPIDAAYAVNCLQSKAPFGSLITISECGTPVKGFLRLAAGPVVTIKSLNLPAWEEKINFTNWSPSLGDLELF
jgi:GNAT superfamily N-acetyltransferase